MIAFGTSVLAGVGLGAAIGLLLAIMVLPIYWRLSEPRVTSVNGSYRTTGIPTTPLDRLDQDQAKAMVRRWQTMSARSSSRIALVAGEAKLEPLTRQAAEWLSSLPVPAGAASPQEATARHGVEAGSGNGYSGSLGVAGGRPVLAALDSSDPGASTEARRSDVIVLVLRSTARVDHVVDRTRELAQLGHRPDWVLLVDSVKKARRTVGGAG